MPHVEQELLSLPGHFSSLPVFNEVRVARSLVAYIVFCISLFILLFDNSVVCHSSFYDVSLPLWHFHTFLIAVGIFLDCTGHFCSFNGYSSEIHPGITQEFQTAAMRWGHTLVTPGLWRRQCHSYYLFTTIYTFFLLMMLLFDIAVILEILCGTFGFFQRLIFSGFVYWCFQQFCYFQTYWGCKSHKDITNKDNNKITEHRAIFQRER